MTNDNNNVGLASAPVNIPHRFLTLAGAVVLGFLLGSPSMLILLMGTPGNCESSPEFCALWELLATLCLAPIYLGLAGAVMAFIDEKGVYFRWTRRLCVLIPLILSICAVIYIFLPRE